jgi:hypothetical protein
MKIEYELRRMLALQKVKNVLVIGEAQSCRKTLSRIADWLIEHGFKYVIGPETESDVFVFDARAVEAYKLIYADPNSVLGWRLLLGRIPGIELGEFISNNQDASAFLNAIPQSAKELHMANADTLRRLITKSRSARKQIAQKSIANLKSEITNAEKDQNELFLDHLVRETVFLERPIANLDIMVCSTLRAKGLGADVVFLIGFDKDRFPRTEQPASSEIYQMLVALTRARKRIYLINTKGAEISPFLQAIGPSNYQVCNGRGNPASTMDV